MAAKKHPAPPPVYVRLPPADVDRHELESNPLLATRRDLADGVEALGDFIAIESRLNDYREINNPLALIEIFLLAMRNGVYPPVGVLKLIESAFSEYYKSEGKVSLDQAMGLKKRGTTPPFKKMLLDCRNDRMFHRMDILMYLGATRDDAATLVAAAMDRDDWNHTMHDMGDLSADTLADLHSRRSLDEPRSEVFKTIAEMNEPGYARAFLKRHFDGLLLPESLRVHVLK